MAATLQDFAASLVGISPVPNHPSKLSLIPLSPGSVHRPAPQFCGPAAKAGARAGLSISSRLSVLLAPRLTSSPFPSRTKREQLKEPDRWAQKKIGEPAGRSRITWPSTPVSRYPGARPGALPVSHRGRAPGNREVDRGPPSALRLRLAQRTVGHGTGKGGGPS